ncbi:hypothetical protein CSKR_110309 [Clonorchis sinensis]|uniref:Guanylate kinase-associated protein mars n=1 Tax=Clonorchis sinensis TaxID=79923 RepID=A0A3R7GSJ9_CLOSI|nr:hypothetical protein CSKR_110309 [Clonorchis sinensis]
MNSMEMRMVQLKRNNYNYNRSPVTFFWCLAAMSPEGNSRAEIQPGCPSLDRTQDNRCKREWSQNDGLTHITLCLNSSLRVTSLWFRLRGTKPLHRSLSQHMPRRVRLGLLPKTPGGRNIQPDAVIHAEEIEVDDVVTVKRSMFRQCVPGNPWFEGDANDPEEEEESTTVKFVVRKSTDLRRIRSIKDRVAALVSSPMVDARPRRESPEDVSPGAKYERNTVTPLRVAHKDDLMHTTSRRLSQMIMNHLNPVATPEPILRKSYFTRVHQPQDPSTLTTPASVPLSNADNKENSQPISGGLSSVQDGTTMKHDQASLNSDQGSQNPESFNTVSAFRVLCDLEMVRLKVLCEDWNAVLGEEGSSLPKIAADSIRATVGKCQLILKNKLPFFQSLVEMAERSSDATSQGVPRTDLNDLAGYWTLVADEIALVDAAFDRLRKWRDRWNWDASQCPTTPPRSLVVAVQRSKRTASSIPKRLATPQQTKKSTRNTPGRKITVDKLSSEVKEAIVQSVQNIPQTRRRLLIVHCTDLHLNVLSFSCSTLSVPNCHATRSLQEGWDTARLPKFRQGKSRGRGRIRTTDLSASKFAL